MERFTTVLIWVLLFTAAATEPSHAWFEETHLAIAKAKMGPREGHNHYFAGSAGTVVTPELVIEQAKRYDQNQPQRIPSESGASIPPEDLTREGILLHQSITLEVGLDVPPMQNKVDNHHDDKTQRRPLMDIPEEMAQ